ncbi:ATP10 protein-domain-containing protein [Cubamyces menziesii]|nr:ATP10 protein-domain-containing protein [Cubamyces menziesii]
MRLLVQYSARQCRIARASSAARLGAVGFRGISSTPHRRAESETSTSPTESKGKEKAQDVEEPKKKAKDAPLPLLQRPLGVRQKPKPRVKSWEDTKEKFLDQDKRLEERHHLAREATRGYFSDLSATRIHGGKTWIAPKVMIREDKALYFPNILGTPLVGKEKVHTTNLLAGKVSVVTLLTTRISEIQTAQFVEPTESSFGSHPLFQRVQINLQDNQLKSFLVSLFMSSIRNGVPEALWPTYLISSENIEYLREPLGIANRHVGYVYLVDPNMKIRWAGCADPKAEEIAALRTCTSVLLDRITKQQESAEAPAAETVKEQEGS